MSKEGNVTKARDCCTPHLRKQMDRKICGLWKLINKMMMFC